jgi:acyl dehydratase
MTEAQIFAQPQVFQDSGDLTPEMLAEAEAMIGQELRIEQYCHEAGLDVIRHYAYGIGDDNPLWCDEEYATTIGLHGTIVAPPTFLYAVFQPGVAPGLPGIQTFNAGGEWVWNRLPRLGERLKATAKMTGLRQIRGSQANELYLQTGRTEYRTTSGELVAWCDSAHFRAPRRGQTGGLAYEPRTERQYTREELERIEHDVFAEVRRGPDTLYWDDVHIGDQLTPVVKGPLDRITMTSYYAGALATSGYKACELRWKNWRTARQHPELIWNNYNIRYFTEWVLGSLGHQDASIAHTVGMPGAYDNGPMRVGWMAHVVTNWMSDAGHLARLNVRIRRPNIFGNTTWCHGRVVAMPEEKFGDLKSVELELWADTQDGERNTEGTAVVHLPVRAPGRS